MAPPLLQNLVFVPECVGARASVLIDVHLCASAFVRVCVCARKCLCTCVCVRLQVLCECVCAGAGGEDKVGNLQSPDFSHHPGPWGEIGPNCSQAQSQNSHVGIGAGGNQSMPILGSINCSRGLWSATHRKGPVCLATLYPFIRMYLNMRNQGPHLTTPRVLPRGVVGSGGAPCAGQRGVCMPSN